MNITNKTIEYHSEPHGFIATIPAGTRVDPADNLPGNQIRFWARAWESIDDTAASWHRNYGFLIQAADVDVDVDCPVCGCSDCDGTCEESSEPDDSMDGDAVSALASAGIGTDEDYGGGEHDWESWQGDSDGSVGCD